MRGSSKGAGINRDSKIRELSPFEKAISVAVLRGSQGGYGSRPRTFGNSEGVPHLRKNGKETTGKHLNIFLRHNNFNEKELEE